MLIFNPGPHTYPTPKRKTSSRGISGCPSENRIYLKVRMGLHSNVWAAPQYPLNRYWEWVREWRKRLNWTPNYGQGQKRVPSPILTLSYQVGSAILLSWINRLVVFSMWEALWDCMAHQGGVYIPYDHHLVSSFQVPDEAQVHPGKVDVLD